MESDWECLQRRVRAAQAIIDEEDRQAEESRRAAREAARSALPGSPFISPPPPGSPGTLTVSEADVREAERLWRRWLS